MLKRYNDFLFESMIFESILVYSDKFRKILNDVDSPVAQALKEQHDIEIDRKKIILSSEHIKELGTYTAQINIHKDIKVTVNLEVIAE